MRVVEIMAKHPKLAIMPFLDGTGELPLARALRLHCDSVIVQILKDNSAGLHDSQEQIHWIAPKWDF